MNTHLHRLMSVRNSDPENRPRLAPLRHVAKGVSVATLALLTSTAAIAADINTIGTLGQRDFRLLSQDLGAALSYKGLVPAETLGITGFDVSFAVTATRLENESILSRAADNADISSTFPVPSLRVYKGLPFGLSIGGMLAQSSATDIRLIGGEVRWAFVPGNVVLPAVAIRGAMTKVTGIDQLDFDTQSVDVSISKGFLMLTPYAGIGRVRVSSTPKGIASLGPEKFSQTRTFVGVNVNLGVNLAFEADKTGDTTSYGVKVGIRF
ncbi:MAG: hypothetical protein AB8C46_22795 [Burkholderiaceae bacterium]